MSTALWDLSLGGLGDIAQGAIALAGFLALVGAIIQTRLMRSHARQARVYDYADRFNRPDTIRLSAEYTDFWATHSFADFDALDRADRSRWLVLPNFIEEVAALYNRKLLDRNVAAEVLGLYVEELWASSLPLVSGSRIERDDRWIYAEWERMQRDTPRRQRVAKRKIERRRTWRLIAQYWMPGDEFFDVDPPPSL